MRLIHPLPSPCVKRCELDAGQRFCVGCARTREEIGAWSRLSQEEQAQVWRQLPQRAQRWNLPVPELPKELLP